MEPDSLTILEPGNGLFGTHVTLEDVNLAIKEHIKIDNELTSDSQMEVIGDGNGFSSRVILVSCQWSAPSDDLPNKIILKIVHFFHIEGIMEKTKSENQDVEKIRSHYETSCRKIHNQEINFYETLKSSKNSGSLLTPEVYFSKKFNKGNRAKGFIGMEYIEGSEVRQEICTLKEIQPILKALAGIQALSFQISDGDFKKIKRESYYKEIMGAMISRDGIKGLLDPIENRYPGRFTDRIERIQEHGSKILNFEMVFNLNEIIGIKNDVLVHGDLWAANILWTSEDKDNYSACKILDYQMAHAGNPAEDLVRFLASTLSGADCQNNWEQLLEKFYNYFQEALGEIQVPYTLDQLKQSYRMYFPFGGLTLLPLFGPPVTAKLRNMEASEAEKHLEVVMEKVECLLEDVEKFYLESF